MNKLGLGIIIVILGLIVPAICVVKSIRFSQDCAGYLKQAADASTVELALERLDKAFDYIEAHNLTEGYTSVLWRTEDENIGYWYNNLTACKGELESGLGGSQLEQSNILMKVRETLTDNGKEGTILTIPHGISRYPDNALYGILLWVSIILILLGIVLIAWGWDEL